MPKTPANQTKTTGKAAGRQAKDDFDKQGRKGAQRQSFGYNSLHDPFDRQLALLGLRVKHITADGNCFFRAISDQLHGIESEHGSLRTRVVEFMQQHQEDFEPFVEDDQSFDAYLARMRKTGVWAGHMEIQATSLLLKCNIHIYQDNLPRWAVTNFTQPAVRALHLSYHGGEHYNSVRLADDYGTGPPVPISDLTSVNSAAKLQDHWSAADEARVAAGTGCDDPVLIKHQLAAVNGDVDAAIETIVEILVNEDTASAAVAQHDGSGNGSNEADAAVGTAPQSAGNGHVAPGADSSNAGDGSISQEHASSPVGNAQEFWTDGPVANVSVVGAVQHADTSIIIRVGSTTQHAAATQFADSSTPAETEAAAIGDPIEAAAAIAAQHTNGTSASSVVPSNSPVSDHIKQNRQRKGVKLKVQASGINTKQQGSSSKPVHADKRPSRNKGCPCGSGRRYKHCCALKSTSSANSKTAAIAAAVQLETLHI